MVKLREKTQASLQAFKEGKNTPLTRGAVLSDGDASVEEEDELSMLGGKTRLVDNGAALARPVTSQIIQESPTLPNLVIPFPLKQGVDESVHPSVLDFLRLIDSTSTRTLQPLNVGSAANGANSMLFTPSPKPDPFFDIATLYPSPPLSAQSSTSQTPQMLGLTESALDMSVFPTYFPVFDHGGSSFGLCSPIRLDIPVSEGLVVRNSTPEASLQCSWEDLMAQFGFN
jgi:hypothetical protein